jgi:hypothetical protein
MSHIGSPRKGFSVGAYNVQKLRHDRVEALVEAAISVCEPENADERATEHTRQVLRRKFRTILGRN